MQLLIWLSLAAIPGLPIWAALAMGGASPDVLTARVLFALSALWASAAGMVWLCTAAGPAWIRVPAGVLIGTYVFVGFPQSLAWINSRQHLVRPPAASPASPAVALAQPTRPPTFREVYEHDFAGLPSLARNVHLQSAKTGEKTAVPVRMLIELNTREKFLSVYIDRNTSSFNTCVFFLYNIGLVFQEMAALPVENNVPNAADGLFGKDFTFDNNIYFYMAEDMSNDAQAYLSRAFREQGMYAHFRGSAYYALHWHDRDLQQLAGAEEAVR